MAEEQLQAKPVKKDENDNRPDLALLEEMSRTSKLLVRRDLELRRVNEELDEKIKLLEEDETRLKEMNEILEIRLKARTRQLTEMVNDLDRQVKERTERIEASRKALSDALDDIKREKAIAEEEKEKTVAIINNFSDGLLVFDSKNLLTIINPAAERLLRVKSIDVAQHPIASLSQMPEFSALFGILGAGMEEISRREFEARADLILEVSTIIIRREGDEHIGKFVILHDITREKTVERLKSEFVSIAAHQLRTPLTSIKWILTSLLAGDFGDMNEEQKDYLAKTNQSNERMINLVDDLLNLSRIEEGRYVRASDNFNLVEVINKNIDNTIFKLKHKAIEISFDKPCDDLQVKADREKISLVVQNLIENAANYSKQGGRVEVVLREDPDKREAIFSVHDYGIGIPDDQKARIFTKFFRAQNAIQAQTVGSGLGLFINKNIIESHGGRIWFESYPEQGTTFAFALPIDAVPVQ